MIYNIVIGAGFGDEGKGNVVSGLVGPAKPVLVVRYSGGQQAGHTVYQNGVKHIFASFGSGTLKNADTYISEHCTISPEFFLNELDVLVQNYAKVHNFNPFLWREKWNLPKVFVDPFTKITTPYDVAKTRTSEYTSNGTCGMGVGATVARHEDPKTEATLYYKDLFFPDYLIEEKLWSIRAYYDGIGCSKEEESAFIQKCKKFKEMTHLMSFNMLLATDRYEHIIFEGSQGLLLDRKFGFFPYVTRSNVGSMVPLEMIKDVVKNDDTIRFNYVTRCFHTRHGEGPLPFEDSTLFKQIDLSDETNVYNEYQKDFRLSPLNLDLLKYAIESDSLDSWDIVSNFPGSGLKIYRQLYVTNMDRFTTDIKPYIFNGDVLYTDKLNSFHSKMRNFCESVVWKIDDPIFISRNDL